MTSANSLDELIITPASTEELLANPGQAEGRSLAGNAILLMGGGLASAFLSALAGLLIAHRLGPANYGMYSIAAALAGAFVHAFLFGLDSILAREIARKSRPMAALLPSAFVPAALWGPVLVLVITGAGMALGYPAEVQRLVILAAAATALRSITTLFRAAFRGIERLEWDALVQVICGVCDLLLVWAALALTGTALGASYGILLSSALTLAVSMVVVNRLLGRQRQFDPRLARSLVGGAVPLGITFLLLGASLRIDTLVLSMFEPVSSVGFYAAAFGCIMMTRPLSQSSAALLPRISALDASKDPRMEAVIVDGLRYTLLMGGMITAAIILLAPSLLRTLYGSAFLPAASSLRILGVVAGLLFLNAYLWNILISIRQERVIFIAAAAGLVAGLVVALVLVPRVGIAGGALAAVGREVVELAVQGRFLSRRVARLVSPRTLLGLALASAALAAALWPFRARTDFAALAWAIPASLLYVGILVFTGAVRRDEARFALGAVTRWIGWRRK